MERTFGRRPTWAQIRTAGESKAWWLKSSYNWQMRKSSKATKCPRAILICWSDSVDRLTTAKAACPVLSQIHLRLRNTSIFRNRARGNRTSSRKCVPSRCTRSTVFTCRDRSWARSKRRSFSITYPVFWKFRKTIMCIPRLIRTCDEILESPKQGPKFVLIQDWSFRWTFWKSLANKTWTSWIAHYKAFRTPWASTALVLSTRLWTAWATSLMTTWIKPERNSSR